MACFLFGSAGVESQEARDAFIGWDATAAGKTSSGRLTQQHSFPHFALGSPGAASGQSSAQPSGHRLNTDWVAKYGHPIELLETFVERNRFRGTCYRAAGWWHVGATTGRSRNDVDKMLRVPVKDIYLLALTSDFRRRLCA